MTPLRLREALHSLRWSQRGLAGILNCDDRLVRRWISGEIAVPPDVGDWLQELADFHSLLPPPAAWRRRAGSDKATETDVPAGGQTVRITSVSWDWQPGGEVTARGMMTVSESADLAPMTLQFEMPATRIPSRAALENPETWLLVRLRRALHGAAPAAAASPP